MTAYPEYLPYWHDTRSQNQKILSGHLIARLSDFNMKLDEGKQYLNLHKNKNILTMTINGIPRNDLQWEGFDFPGKVVNYIPPGQQIGKSEQFYQQRLKKANIKDTLAQMDEIVERYGGKVLLCAHSFGCFMATMYAHHYPQKVVGLIEFGGLTLSFYGLLKMGVVQGTYGKQQVDLNAIFQLKDLIHSQYAKSFKKTKMNIIQNPYNLIGFFVWFTDKFLGQVFQWRRNLPKNLLKLIAFGRSDKVFQPVLLNEMAVHFTYGPGSLTEQTSSKLWKVYQANTQSKVPQLKSIQQRFVYSFIKTGHGPHLVKKPELQNLINLYLGIVLHNIENRSNL